MISAPKQMADSAAAVPRSSVNVVGKEQPRKADAREVAPSLYISGSGMIVATDGPKTDPDVSLSLTASHVLLSRKKIK